MKIQRSVFILLLGTVFISSVYATEPHEGVMVGDAWVRPMPPSQKTTAAFMLIKNLTDKEVTLVSASTDIAEKIEIHEMKHINGMMKMRMAPEIRIPSQGQVVFDSEGFHLMIINLKKALVKGDTVPIVLKFSNGDNVTINASVEEKDDP